MSRQSRSGEQNRRRCGGVDLRGGVFHRQVERQVSERGGESLDVSLRIWMCRGLETGGLCSEGAGVNSGWALAVN